MTYISSAHFFNTQNELQRSLRCIVLPCAQEKEVLWQTPDVLSTTEEDTNFPTWPANVGMLGKTVGGDSAPTVRDDVGCDNHFN